MARAIRAVDSLHWAVRRLSTLLLGLALVTACSPEPTEPDVSVAAEAQAIVVDQALLADLLGEAVEVADAGTSADGLLIRLAFEPLIRQTGPVSLQLVQSTGYRLLGVAEGAPLWQLGLREGGVLTTVDGHAIIGREHELRSQWERRPSRVEVGYQRDGQARTLSLRIRPGSAWRGSEPTPSALEHVGRADNPLTRSPIPTGRPTQMQAELPAGIRCTPADTVGSLGRCEIERANVEYLTENPAYFAKQARIVPDMQDGVTQGYKLYGIRSGSLPSQLGIQNGDVIVAIDGMTLSNLDATLAAFSRLPALGTVTVTIERRGATMQLTIAIVDALN
jgi:membrane-associated protease RseP (regulator of RpoE activity)